MSELTKALGLMGLDKTATLADLKAAGTKLAMAMHPDKGGSMPEFILMRNAWGFLKTKLPESRRCLKCKGKGRVTKTKGFHSMKVRCPQCKGKRYDP